MAASTVTNDLGNRASAPRGSLFPGSVARIVAPGGPGTPGPTGVPRPNRRPRPTAVPRPTGVLVYPRFHDPGAMDGMYWLPTTEASYLSWELVGTPAGGTVEIITEDFAPAGSVPPYLMGI